MKNKYTFDKKIFRLLIIAILIFISMSIATNGRFLSINNLSSMLFLTPELGILSLGIMIAMIVGGIDLSIVSIANLSAILGAKTMLMLGNSPFGILLGIIVAIFTGLLCGLFNGFIISRLKVSPILVTLGTFQVFQGIAIVITKGSAVTNLSANFIYFGNGSFIGIPYPFITLLVIWQLIVFILNKTSFGASLYLIGTNYKVSVYSGLKSDKILNQVYGFIGILGALAGLIMVARTNSAKADYGLSYTLQTILICMLGGVSWSGGIGKPIGVIISVFVLQFLASGFGILRYSNFFTNFTSGVFLILILIFYYYMEKYDDYRLKKKLIK